MLRRSAGTEEAAARRATVTALRCMNILRISTGRSGERCIGAVCFVRGGDDEVIRMLQIDVWLQWSDLRRWTEHSHTVLTRFGQLRKLYHVN